MKYIVYLTTNTKCSIDGHQMIYIGVHKTENPEIFDGYIGNGVFINWASTYNRPRTPFQYAVKKYGVHAFKRELLYVFDSHEEAYQKEFELVNENFISLPYTYNMVIGGGDLKQLDKVLYQFDLDGSLLKKWDCVNDVAEYYGINCQKIRYNIHDKHSLLGCYWSYYDKIDINAYRNVKKGNPRTVYLYSVGGKCIGIFDSQKELAQYIGIKPVSVNTAIRRGRLVQGRYYISNYLVDVFVPREKINYKDSLFYVYKENNDYIGCYNYSNLKVLFDFTDNSQVRDVVVDGNGWYKSHYISLEKVNSLPERREYHREAIDVYDNNGKFIETVKSFKEIYTRYKVPKCRFKNIRKREVNYNRFTYRYHCI